MAKNTTSFKPGHRGGGRPKGRMNRVTLEARTLARQFLEDPEYLASLRRRLIRGQAPHIETLLFAYAFGRPTERHEVAALTSVVPTPSPVTVDRTGTATVAGLTLTQATRERVLAVLEAQGATPPAESTTSVSSESAG